MISSDEQARTTQGWQGRRKSFSRELGLELLSQQILPRQEHTTISAAKNLSFQRQGINDSAHDDQHVFQQVRRSEAGETPTEGSRRMGRCNKPKTEPAILNQTTHRQYPPAISTVLNVPPAAPSLAAYLPPRPPACPVLACPTQNSLPETARDEKTRPLRAQSCKKADTPTLSRMPVMRCC